VPGVLQNANSTASEELYTVGHGASRWPVPQRLGECKIAFDWMSVAILMGARCQGDLRMAEIHKYLGEEIDHHPVPQTPSAPVRPCTAARMPLPTRSQRFHVFLHCIENMSCRSTESRVKALVDDQDCGRVLPISLVPTKCAMRASSLPAFAFVPFDLAIR
jgi:hypothetical protein